MKGYKYKITPEAYKQIETLAQKLPKLQRIGKDGKPLFRAISKLVKGSELPEGTTVNGGEPVDPKKNYIRRGQEPVLVNHKVNLIEEYGRYGPAGIETYKRYVMSIIERDKKVVEQQTESVKND